MTDKTQNEAVELLRSTPLGGSVQLVICRQLMEKQNLAAQVCNIQCKIFVIFLMLQFCVIKIAKLFRQC